MINIQNAFQVTYGDGKYVTVYRDFDDPNLLFIVPIPRLAMQTVEGRALPAFALTEYKNNTGAAGSLTFAVELAIDPEARAAVIAREPSAQIGQFKWGDTQVYLAYSLGEKALSASVTPSNYGGNVATFSLTLASAEEVNVVKKVFNPGHAGVTTFGITYQVSTLAQLRGVEATVTYDPKQAAEYEKKWEVTGTDCWGNATAYRSVIEQQLDLSDSGKVEIEWFVQPDPEFEQRVNDWAYTTLEHLVQNAVDTVTRQLASASADKFTVKLLGTLTRTYDENEVVDWLITPSAYLPSFSPEEWKHHYSFVDNRQCIVTATALRDLADAKVRALTVNVKYGDDVWTFPFDKKSPTSQKKEFAGRFDRGKFVSTFSYSYVVDFEEGPPYKSGEIQTDNPVIEIDLNLLGTQIATFHGSNIRFVGKSGKGPAVDFVLVDFVYLPGGDNPMVTQQQKLRANEDMLTFKSALRMPVDASYRYALTYIMEDGAPIVCSPVPVFPPSNRQDVTLFSGVTDSSVTVSVVEDKQFFIHGYLLSARYEDTQNPGFSEAHTFYVKPDPTREKVPDDQTWEYFGTRNSAGSTITFDGQLYVKDEKGKRWTVRMDNVAIAATADFNVLLLSNAIPYTVRFDPTLVDWETVELVQIDAYRLDPAPPGITPGSGKTDVYSMTFQKMEGIKIVPDGVYTFSVAPDDKSPSFHFSGTYYMKDGTQRTIESADMRGQYVVLPKVPTGRLSLAKDLRVDIKIARERVEGWLDAERLIQPVRTGICVVSGLGPVVLSGYNIEATYEDFDDPRARRKHVFFHKPDAWRPAPDASWTVPGHPNRPTTWVRFNGDLYLSRKNPRSLATSLRAYHLRNVIVPAGVHSPLFVAPSAVPYTVTFDPSLIDWSTHQLVVVQAFQIEGEAIARPEELSRADWINVTSMIFGAPTRGQSIAPQFYQLNVPPTPEAVTVYYGALYVTRAGSIEFLTVNEDQGQVVFLPERAGTSKKRTLLRTTVTPQISDGWHLLANV